MTIDEDSDEVFEEADANKEAVKQQALLKRFHVKNVWISITFTL